MKRALAAILALAGCLSPSYSDQTHCSKAGLCPADRMCTTSDSTGYCIPKGGLDAAVGDGGGNASLVLHPGSNDFGTVITGTTGTVTFMVDNAGDADSGSLSITLDANSGAFALGAGTCAGVTLAPGASCTQVVSFLPTSVGDQGAALVVRWGPTMGVQANLSGHGAAPGSLSIDKTTDDFGSIELTTDSTAHTYIVTNSASSLSGALTVALSGGGASDFIITGGTCAGMSVAAGGTCTVVAHFHASQLGLRTASLTISGTGGTAMSTLGGTGVAAPTCHPVINEILTGTLTSGTEEYVELFNPCGSAIDLTGWKLGYRAVSNTDPATSADPTILVSFGAIAIAPGGYLLYAGAAYPGTRDGTLVGTSGIASMGGGVALRDTMNFLVDSVCWVTSGTGNSICEGGPATAPPITASPGTSLARTPNGTDTNVNMSDFRNATPTPKAANQ